MELSAATVRTQPYADRAMCFSLPVVDFHDRGLNEWLEICLTQVQPSVQQFSLVSTVAESESEIEETAPSPNAALEFSGPASGQMRTRNPLPRQQLRLVSAGGNLPRPSPASGSTPGAGVGDWTVMSSPLVATCPTTPCSLGLETCSAESVEEGASPMSAVTEPPAAAEVAEPLPQPVEMPLGQGDAENLSGDSSRSGENAGLNEVAPPEMELGSRGNAMVEEAAMEAPDVLTSAGVQPMELRAEAAEVQQSAGQAVVPTVARGGSYWNGLDFHDLLESLADQEAALLANRPQPPAGGELAVLRYGYDVALRIFPKSQIFDVGPDQRTKDLARRAYGAAQNWCRTVERGIELVTLDMSRERPIADVRTLERAQGMMMLAEVVRQFLDIVRRGGMVHFMLVAQGQKRGWLPYMHEQEETEDTSRSTYLWVKKVPAETFPYGEVVHYLVQKTADALEKAGFLAREQTEASAIVLRSPRAEVRAANAEVVSRCADLRGDVVSWQRHTLWRGYNSSLQVLSQVDHPRRLIWKDCLDTAMPLWSSLAFDGQESPRLSVWATGKGQFLYILRKEESDRLGLYKIAGTSVVDVQLGRPDVPEANAVQEEMRVNNGQKFEMADGAEARNIGEAWDGYSLKSGPPWWLELLIGRVGGMVQGW